MPTTVLASGQLILKANDNNLKYFPSPSNWPPGLPWLGKMAQNIGRVTHWWSLNFPLDQFNSQKIGSDYLSFTDSNNSLRHTECLCSHFHFISQAKESRNTIYVHVRMSIWYVSLYMECIYSIYYNEGVIWFEDKRNWNLAKFKYLSPINKQYFIKNFEMLNWLGWNRYKFRVGWNNK